MDTGENYAKYADIIDLPHHQSVKRPHMSLEARAAQFSPFAALTGYEDAVKETARLTQDRIELEEYGREQLNRALHRIEQCGGQIHVEITYFVPDVRKEGGSYRTVKGLVKKLKEYERLLVMEDGTEIPISEIIEIVEI